MTKPEARRKAFVCDDLRHSVILASFVIRHSDFVIFQATRLAAFGTTFAYTRSYFSAAVAHEKSLSIARCMSAFHACPSVYNFFARMIESQNASTEYSKNWNPVPSPEVGS